MANNEKPEGKTKKCSKCQENIQFGAKKCKHCGADLRNWFVRHKIISGILILIAIGIIASSMNGGDKNNRNNNNLTATTNQSNPTTENQPKEWQKVADITANSNKQSNSFHLEGGQQKIVYKTTGGQMSICTIYVMNEGTSLEEGGGFPVVMIDGSKSDETMMRKGAGDYYFDLKVANGTCIAELQELR